MAHVVENAAESASGFERFWGSVTSALSGLVKVTPPDQARMPLISPAAEYFLRTNLTLKLQAARLALLRGQQTIFEQSLDDATAWGVSRPRREMFRQHRFGRLLHLQK